MQHQHQINTIPDSDFLFVRDLHGNLAGTTSTSILRFIFGNLDSAGSGAEMVDSAEDGSSFVVSRAGIWLIEFGSQISATGAQVMAIGRGTTLPYTDVPSFFAGGASILASGQLNTNGAAGEVQSLQLSAVQAVTQAQVDAGTAVFYALASAVGGGTVGSIADTETWFRLTRIAPMLD